MPDKNPDAGPPGHTGVEPTPEELLRHRAPPGLKRLGKIAVVAALVIAAAGIGWRWWQSHTTAAWTEDQAVPNCTAMNPPEEMPDIELWLMSAL